MERNEFILKFLERKKKVSPINLRKASCEVGIFPVLLSNGDKLLAEDIEGPIRDVDGKEEWYDISVIEESIDFDEDYLSPTVSVNARHIVCIGCLQEHQNDECEFDENE